MYGVPDDEEMQFLVGQQVQQVCLGINEFILHFDKDASINVTGDAAMFYGLDEDQGRSSGDRPMIAAALTTLLDVPVTSVAKISREEIVIGFQNGARLALLDTDEHYECFTVNGPLGILVA